MTAFRLATFNVENLFARFKFEGNVDSAEAVKDGWNVNETCFDISDAAEKLITGQLIRDTKADVIALQAVENLDTLKRFRSDYLGGPSAYPYAISRMPLARCSG